jgi:hypothetical protein
MRTTNEAKDTHLGAQSFRARVALIASLIFRLSHASSCSPRFARALEGQSLLQMCQIFATSATDSVVESKGAGGRVGVFDDPETAGQRLPCGPRAFVAKPAGRSPGRRRLRPGHPSSAIVKAAEA